MLDAVPLPWWAVVYLLIFFVLTFSEFLMDFRRRPLVLLGDVLSFCFACVCVMAYFDPTFAQPARLFLPLIVVIGLGWEFVQSIVNTKIAEEEMKAERDISDDERSMLLSIGISLGGLIVLPAYMMGLKVCLDMAIAALGWGGA